jgi:hypothetical protein
MATASHIPKHALGCGPQGLRRPRFSFFRFTFQTARGREAPSPRVGDEKTVEATRLPTTDRKLGSLFQVRCFERHAVTPEQCAAPVVGYIFGAPFRVNTIATKKNRAAPQRPVFSTCGVEPLILQVIWARAVLRPHCSAVLLLVGGTYSRAWAGPFRIRKSGDRRGLTRLSHHGIVPRLFFRSGRCLGGAKTCLTTV